MSVRRDVARGLVERKMGEYELSTIFEDGRSIFTWSYDTKRPDDDWNMRRAGTGTLAVDYASHVKAVATRMCGSARVMAFSDLETGMALANQASSSAPWFMTVLRAKCLFALGAPPAIWVALQWALTHVSKGH